MDQIPNYIDLSAFNLGKADRLFPRGMSDYARGAGRPDASIFVTENGFKLHYLCGKWRAQHKNFTSKWKASMNDAVQDVINKTNTIGA
jgi:hypothetical protein